MTTTTRPCPFSSNSIPTSSNTIPTTLPIQQQFNTNNNRSWMNLNFWGKLHWLSWNTGTPPQKQPTKTQIKNPPKSQLSPSKSNSWLFSPNPLPLPSNLSILNTRIWIVLGSVAIEKYGIKYYLFSKLD